MCHRSFQDYVNRLYQRDPSYHQIHAARRDTSDNATGFRVLSVSSESIRDQEYRRLLYEEPGILRRFSLVDVLDGQPCYVSIYFSRPIDNASGIQTLIETHGRTLISLAFRHFQSSCENGMKPRTDSLSPREMQVAEMLWKGLTAKEVAKALGLSPTTVVTYKSRLFEKLKVSGLKQFLRCSSTDLRH